MKIIVKDEQEIRIDFFLASKLDYSRSKIQRMLSESKIIVNNDAVKSSYLIKEDDEIVIDEEELIIEIIPQKIDFKIVYENDQLLVIDKPNGLVVHPGAGNRDKTLVNGLVYYFKNLSFKNSFRPGLVHRLDAYTTGLMVVAKNEKIHDYLSEEIKKNKMERKYYALVWGVINNDTGLIDASIMRDVKDRTKYKVGSKNSKSAITHFRVMERYKTATLVEVALETGRTHQIRVHMDYIGFPIVNDPVYGKRKLFDNSGQCLHAKTLSFIEYGTEKKLFFESDLAECFKNILFKFQMEVEDESNENNLK